MSNPTDHLTFSRSPVPLLPIVNIFLPSTKPVLAAGNISDAMEAPNLLLALSPSKAHPPFPSRPFPTKIKMKSQTPICSATPSLRLHTHSGHSAVESSGPRGTDQRKVLLRQQAVEASAWCQHHRPATLRLCPKCQRWLAGSGAGWTAPGCRAGSAGAGLSYKRKGSQSDKHEWEEQEKAVRHSWLQGNTWQYQGLLCLC